MTDEPRFTMEEWAAAQALVATIGAGVLVAMLVKREVLPADAPAVWRELIRGEIEGVPASAIGGDNVKTLALRAASLLS